MRIVKQYNLEEAIPDNVEGHSIASEEQESQFPWRWGRDGSGQDKEGLEFEDGEKQSEGEDETP